ncbi:ADP-ribosyltransferase [Streptomyces sp. L2]|uniref:ADP-ribosyltransferase n=1 Tax=Streptomyces sp. L2 TaxID=2162665 RepID=UPI0010126FEC|nr:ADP-ribosyltransferase [Streptomyces sp. L2]
MTSTTRSRRRRGTAAVLSLGAVLATTAATAPTAAPARTVHAAPAAKAAASCPQFDDKLRAAADRRADLDRITPKPAWRTTCGTLWRSDNRDPETVFEEGFQPKDVINGQYDIEKYVLVNQPSPYVSTTYDHDLFKAWKSKYNYYVDAPGGIDVNKTIGSAHKYADQVEVAFPGGIARQYIVGACPVDKETKTEILSGCESNPFYAPWH